MKPAACPAKQLVRDFIQDKLRKMEVCNVSQHATHKQDYERLKEILRALENGKQSE